MKQIHFNLFALLILLSCGQLRAQEQALPYKSKAMFGEDTLQYLKYNYSERGKYYNGKTVGDILNELEYPVLYVTGMHLRNLSGGPNISKLGRLCIGIQQVSEKPHELLDDYLLVSLENPPESSDFRAVYDSKNPVLTSELYNYIKDLKVSFVSLNTLPREELKRRLKNNKEYIEREAKAKSENQEK